MNSSRFDQLTTEVSRRLTRRQALIAGATGLAAGFSERATPLSAEDATPVASPEAAGSHPAFLFVQLANAGSWTPKPDEEGVYLLTLAGAGSQTLYFSDRPDRIVGTLSTNQFLEGLGFSPFEPPNAAVVVTTPEGERDVLVVELFSPIYTQSFGAESEDVLIYHARVIDAYQGEGLDAWVPQADDDQLPQQFSDISLFIDDCADLSGCYRHNGPNSGGTYVGEVPGGPYGRCWYWSDLNCFPCTGKYDFYKYDQMCNQSYPACQNRCYTNTCMLGIC